MKFLPTAKVAEGLRIASRSACVNCLQASVKWLCRELRLMARELTACAVVKEKIKMRLPRLLRRLAMTGIANSKLNAMTGMVGQFT